MHPMLLAAQLRARGVGNDDIWIGSDPLGNNLPTDLPRFPIPGSSNSGGGIDWNQIINNIFGLVNNIFGRQLPQQQLAQQQQLALLAAQQQAALAAQRGDLASGSIGSDGLRIGNTSISWLTVIVAGGAFLLLQSRGFERRK